MVQDIATENYLMETEKNLRIEKKSLEQLQKRGASPNVIAEQQKVVGELKEKYEEAKAASAQTLGTSDDASYCFYDVTFVADGQELSPEKGTVTIKMEFKNIQINAEAQTQNIVHIEDTEAGRQVQDVTSVSGDGSNLQSVDFAM